MDHKFWIVNKVNKTTAEIFLYGYIDPYDVSAGDFVKELRQLEKEHQNINVRINSGGGSVFEGLAIYNAMQISPANIETYIDGLAASMASIIAIGGKKCHMSKSARIMTHQPSGGSYGTTEEHKKNAKVLEGIENTMLSIYAAKTGKKEEECRTLFMNGKDCWFDAEEAKEKGLVDEIYDNAAEKVSTEKKDAKNVWEMYSSQQFAAVFNNSNNNMKQYFLSAASLAAMKLAENADQSVIDAKISELVAEAAKVPQLTQDLTTANAAKKKAEDDLAAEKKTNVATAITKQLDDALEAKKITAEQKALFATKYAEDADGLKVLLATMQPYASVVDTLKNDAVATKRLEALAAKSGDELFNSGELEELKGLNMDVFKAKYKEAFKEDYKEETAK